MLNTYTSSPDILAITETWFSDSKTEELSGYLSFNQYRQHRPGGRTSLFIKCHLNATKLDEFCFNLDELESIAIKLNYENKDIIIISIYRPPGNPINIFSDNLGQILNSLKGKNIVLLWDFNIDLFQENNTQIHEFTSLMHSFHFLPLVTKATHFSPIPGINQLLLDYMWSNLPANSSTFIITGDFKNHLPVSFNLSIPQSANRKTELIKTSFQLINETTKENFRKKLMQLNWDTITNPNPNTYLDAFTTKINSIWGQVLASEALITSARAFIAKK